MLYRKFKLVPETDWNRFSFLCRNRHSQTIFAVEEETIFTKSTGKIAKILLSHGSEDGTIHKEVDLPAILYDKFDLVICCHPKQVMQYFQSKFAKAIPVVFPTFDKILWTRWSRTANGIFLEVSDEKEMTEAYDDFVTFNS